MFADFQDIAIATLDLDPIKFKLIHPEAGEGWSRARVDAVELEYRRFLFLMKKYPDEVTAPLIDVDTFWHYHILDTMKYAADCERIFGYFLHHFPYYGMRGEEDFESLSVAGNRMHELYEETFGVAQFAAAQVLPAYRETAGDRKAAYCIRSAEAAYCIMASDSAHCIETSKTAYCIKASESAYCIKASGPAYCIKASDAAYCIKASDAAYCIKSPVKSLEQTISSTNYGIRDGTPQQSAGTTAAFSIMPSPGMNRPNLERPRLTPAAA